MTCTSGQRHSGVKILNALNVSLDWGNAPVCCLHWRRARSGCWLLWWADPSRCARCSGWHRAVAFPTAGQLSGPPGPLSPRGRPYQDLRRQEICHYSEVIVTFFHVDVEQDEPAVWVKEAQFNMLNKPTCVGPQTNLFSQSPFCWLIICTIRDWTLLSHEVNQGLVLPLV